MNRRIRWVSGACLAMLLGCSHPPVEEPLQLQVPPPEVSMDLPLESEPPPGGFKGEFCKLGQSCLAMDPRPFEPCVVETARCADKITEPLLVGEPSAKVVPLPASGKD